MTPGPYPAIIPSRIQKTTQFPKDDITIFKAGPPAYGGSCLARREDGKIVFLEGAIPGETVEARIHAEKKDFARATVVRLLEPSPDRVIPPCKYFGDCGGCQIQYMDYRRQVGVKEEVLRETLRRVAGIEAELSAPLTGRPFGYRRRARFKVWRDRVGFYRANSHRVVDVDACPLMADEVNAALREARALAAGNGVRELRISSGLNGTAALLTAGGGAALKSFGVKNIDFDLDGLAYMLSPAGFFQGNWELNVQLVKLLCDSLGPLSGKRVLDLYSGAGNFSFPLARLAEEVVAVEENPMAVEDGNRNAGKNGIDNCRFICSDAGSVEAGGSFDVIVADPPRTGLSEGAVERIMQLRPERFAYVSCDPATLARDLKKLKAAYEVEIVRLVDFFPQTYHIEVLTVLTPRRPEL